MSSSTWFNVLGRRRLPIVYQASPTECGLACVAMLAAYRGVATDLIELRRRHTASLKGATLDTIVRTCKHLGLSTRAVRCDISEIENLSLPCVLHWRFNHFVVLRSISRKGAVIHDPARGTVHEDWSTLESAFTGVALEVAAPRKFAGGRQTLQLKLTDLLPRGSVVSRRFVLGVVLAIVCEALILVSPLYLQTVIDGVIVNGDRLLLQSLVLAFSCLLLFQVAATAMRSLTFQFLGHVTAFDIARRLLHRLIRLPLRYFRSRELGDTQHRFQSLTRVQAFIVNSAPSLLIDTLFVVLLGVLMLLYDIRLTLLNLGAVVAWCGWRATLLPWRVRLASEITVAESDTQTHFLESLRAMASVKAAGGETVRESEWLNLFAETINARVRAGNLQIADTAIQQCLLQGSRVFTVFLLGHMALEGRFTIGMISAYAAYLGMFTVRSSALVAIIFEYKLLRVPLDRLADIVFNEAEPDFPQSSELKLGDIELRDVSFSYSENEAPILRDCSATIRQGSFVALAGVSGSGKSTLLQLIAGIETAGRGEVRFGGCKRHVNDLRRQTATVLQDDRLLRGSVAANIALFDEQPDYGRIRRAAAQAGIAEEIEAFPMRLETRIADLGSSLSCGQVQRVLLARAFYRDARLLLLDEATSGLNPDLEKHVIESLLALSATRVVVTHSDQMLAAADEVLWLRNGTLLSSRPAFNV